MIHISAVDSYKDIAQILVKAIPGGVRFWLVEGNTVVWTICSEGFGMQLFKVGDVLGDHYASMQAVKQKRF
jgi:hypothetical protein